MTLAEQETFAILGTIEDAPVTFTWGGADYEGTRGQTMTKEDNAEGGFLPEPALSVITTLQKKTATGELIDRFPGDLPSNGERVTVDSAGYRIDTTTTDELDVVLVLTLISDDV